MNADEVKYFVLATRIYDCSSIRAVPHQKAVMGHGERSGNWVLHCNITGDLEPKGCLPRTKQFGVGDGHSCDGLHYVSELRPGYYHNGSWTYIDPVCAEYNVGIDNFTAF